MSYKSILVNIDIDGPAAPIVGTALDLARRFDARLIGFSAADARMPFAGPDGGAIAAEVWEQDRQDIETRLKGLRAEFEAMTHGVAGSEWRGTIGDPTGSLAMTARLADLVVTSGHSDGATGGPYRRADPAGVAVRAGRPLLLVADKADRVRAKRIVVAWKDTPEARRAVSAAVPLLVQAEEVIIVTVARSIDTWIRDSAKDTHDFLTAHGVKAETDMIESADETLGLLAFIETSGAELVVSGAYGHSRLREWAFGGVTRSLLDEIARNRFMAN